MASAEVQETPRAANLSLVALKCAWPAIAVAALALLPFLNTPFTIDDPLFLQEARHAIQDPLHPQAFDVVWSAGLQMRASNLLAGGLAAPYILIPTVLSGNKEWVAHLTQIALLAVALFGTALVALRLGVDRRGAAVAALLAGTAPAVLGMAGTAMPDVAAMMYSVLGMERILAWRERRKWHRGLLAVVWLSLAALTRLHTVLLLAPAFVFLLDGIRARDIRSSFRNFPARFVTVAAVPLVVLLAIRLAADPEALFDRVTVRQTYLELFRIAANVCAFFTHWFLTAPLTVSWLVLRWRNLSWRLAVFAIGCATALAPKLGWAAYLAAATALVFGDIFLNAVRHRDRVRLALGLWLMPALALAIYADLPSRYVVPLIPAAAILIARILPDARPAVRRWLPGAAVMAGLIVSILVLSGIRGLARAQRRAAQELVAPRTLAVEPVWFAGQWGFHWYAEAAGAKPAVWLGITPNTGDIIVVSLIDVPAFARNWTRKRVIQRVAYDSGGRVMDMDAGAGFFSNVYGYLPWVWAKGDANVFEVWRVE
ncbi:MAG TPA: glycosyltransferase family 39 protein [Bryobacteraceae bacterium]|nr:glycosyltransferase family 39 protein [Bryobacteraceae bacterium]